jgi:transporter family-2 protein
MVGLFIAILSGICMSVQGVFNAEVTRQSGMWVTNVFVQGSAMLVCFLIWAVSDRSSFSGLLKVEPKYMLLGGAIGAVITYTVVKSMDALGPAKAVMFIVIAQLIAAYIIEIFGMFGVEKQPFELRKAIGMAVAIIGIVVFKWK